MLGNSIVVENMNHLAMAFPLVNDIRSGVLDGEENFHSRQQDKKRIKLQLIFVVPTPENPNYNFLDSPPTEKLPRLASVRVPRGLPVAKIRLMITYIEGELQDIFGRSKRANFVMVCDEGSEMWTFSFDLPTIGVVYV